MIPKRKSLRGPWRWGIPIVILCVIGGWFGCLLRQLQQAKTFERGWRTGNVATMNSLLVGDKWISKRADDGALYYTLENAGRGHRNDKFYNPQNPGNININPSYRIIPYDLADFWEFKSYYLTGKREIFVYPNEDIEGRFDVTIISIHVHKFYSGLKAVK